MPRYRNSLNWERPPNENASMTRRTVLAILGLGGLIALMQACGASLFGFLYPNAMKIPPSIFSLGRPEEVLSNEGKVFIPKQKAFVEVANGKVRVQTAVCTHLGCTVHMVETGYQCPCHGSTYDQEGHNTGGPAPRPLIYFTCSMDASGEVQVDKTRPIRNPTAAWFSPLRMV